LERELEIDAKIVDCDFTANWGATRTAQVYLHECNKPRCQALVENATFSDSRHYHLEDPGRCGGEYYQCNCKLRTSGTTWSDLQHKRCYDERNADGTCTAPNGICQDYTKAERQCMIGHDATVVKGNRGYANNWALDLHGNQFVGYDIKLLPCNERVKYNLMKQAIVASRGATLKNIHLASEIDTIELFRTNGMWFHANGPVTIYHVDGTCQTSQCKGVDANGVTLNPNPDYATHSPLDENRPVFELTWDGQGQTYDTVPTWLESNPVRQPSKSCYAEGGVC